MDKPPVRTTVYLDEDAYEELKRIAQKEGRVTAELVREAIAEYTSKRTRRRTPRSLGAGTSKRGDLSERAEDLLKGMGR
jgi:hypothetical protein